MKDKYEKYFDHQLPISYLKAPKPEVIQLLDDLLQDEGFRKEDPKLILDIASGDGRHILPAVQRGFHVHGIEKTQAGVKTTRRILQKYGLDNLADIQCGDMKDLKIKPNTYIGIIFYDAIHFLPNKNFIKKYLKKVQKGTKKNGRNLITFLTDVKLDGKAYPGRIKILPHEAQNLFLKSYNDWETTILSQKEIKKEILEYNNKGLFGPRCYSAIRISLLAKKLREECR